MAARRPAGARPAEPRRAAARARETAGTPEPAPSGGEATGGAGGSSAAGGEAGGGETLGGAGAGGAENGGTDSGGAGAGGTENGGAETGGAGAGGGEAGGPGTGGTNGDAFVCDTNDFHLATDAGQTEDGMVAFELLRCMPQLCAGGCPVLDVFFSLTYQGRTDEATSSEIEYTQTHHNWADDLVATLSDRRLRWRTQVPEAGEFILEHHVAVEDLEGNPILVETQVPAP
jgi:hypothetical protein